MNKVRRRVLKLAGGAGAWTAAVAAGLLSGSHALAANRNEAALTAKRVQDVLKHLGASGMAESKDIVITAPDIAENGAVVPVAVTSKIPNTESIAIVAEKNPFPLAATFDIMPGTDAYISTRLKMGQTTDVRAIVKAGGKYFTAAKEVKVTVGGCG
ncbi:MAG: thiosulfate oxidation carrier protein SoxY [Betaproteobacteria bacterium]|nr:thiosulfate oxidation carrier protein SoxY [Betaproteobacteria bacterium]